MKKIFSGNDNYNKSAFLNWRIAKRETIGNLLVLAEGYLSSAIELAQNCLRDNSNKKADMLIFPILMNANHGIELYLKALIWIFNKLMGSEKRIEGSRSHNIQQLFRTVRAKLKEYKDEDWLRHFDEQNADLASYIEELFSLIGTGGKSDNMDFSRYPISNKYENHFYVHRSGNIEIDLENFILRFENIKEALDERASYFFYQELNGEW